ncbi:hypothetical protein [Actinocorallia sp. A-T 12471]|uniref:hypothetical protein n=1 Tax=Actinocorallia sp. A-T 12471 TaxID=3089813 RepID=UPI0029CAEA9D|nr:hypothetical protein [Actinocorallia sp. A-T 12471]MDX6743262.1 hypothetical protein [Actinocorallia sp. A-T 12471]
MWLPGRRDEAVQLAVGDRDGGSWFRYGDDGDWLAPVADPSAAAKEIVRLLFGGDADAETVARVLNEPSGS